MEWWQVILIILAAVVVGVGCGILVSQLIVYLTGKRRAAALVSSTPAKAEMPKTAPVVSDTPAVFTVRDQPAVVAEPPPVQAEALKTAPVANDQPAPANIRDRISAVGDLTGKVKKRWGKEPGAAPMADEQLKAIAIELLTETKTNRKIADGAKTDKLVAFETKVWDARQYEIDRFSAELRQELEQAYTDMRLANSVVWLSTEFSRRTANLDDNYMKLCSSVGQRLDTIKPLIEKLAK